MVKNCLKVGDNMIKVLQVIPCLSLGGTEAYVMEHYRSFSNNVSCDFAVFSLQDSSYVEEIHRDGRKIYLIGQPSLKAALKFCRNLKRAIKDNGGYDVMHCHANEGNALPLICGIISGVRKRIAHSHAICNKPDSLLGKLAHCFRRTVIKLFATDFIACSGAAGESLFGKKLFSNKGKILKNGINVQKFMAHDAEDVNRLRKEFQIGEDTDIVVGNISRFDSNKNHVFALDVFNELLKYYPNALFLLGGTDGGELRNIETKIHTMGLENKVRLIGRRQDVPACLKLVDIYLFPSKQEGLGIAVLEAQAAGCMCVTSTDVPAEVDVGIGRVVQLPLENDAVYWAQKITEAVASKKTVTATEIMEAFFKSGYEITVSARKLEELYAEGKWRKDVRTYCEQEQ